MRDATPTPPPPWRGSGVVPWDSKDRPDVPSRRLLWRPAAPNKRPTEETSQSHDRHRFRSHHRVLDIAARWHAPSAVIEADVRTIEFHPEGQLHHDEVGSDRRQVDPETRRRARADTGPTPASEPGAGFVALDSADFREVYHSADGGFNQRWGEPGAPRWLEELDATATVLTAGALETSELLAGRNTFVEVVPTRLAQGLSVMVEALRSDRTQITVVAS